MNDLKKILIIGPAYPYRGGISHYTGLLAQNLNKKYDVKILSFKMQYPKLLYKSEQKHYDSKIFAYSDTDYEINTLDPFTWKRVKQKIIEWQTDLIIVQWWHPYFAPAWRGIIKGIHDNIPVVFICHNVYPHESRIPFVKQLTKATLALGSGSIVHSDSEVTDLKSLIPAGRYRKTALPIFNNFMIEDISKEAARDKLGISEHKHVLLFFGFIRKYKGLKYLLEAMPEIIQDYKETELLVVGDFFENDKDEYLKLIEDTGCGEHITLVDGYLPDREVEPYFAACDLVILPYISATQSGIVPIAYGFNKAVIATRVGGLPDVVIDGHTGYLVEPQNATAIATAIKNYFSNDSIDYEEEIKKQNDQYSWDRMVETIEDLYGEIQNCKR